MVGQSTGEYGVEKTHEFNRKYPHKTFVWIESNDYGKEPVQEN